MLIQTLTNSIVSASTYLMYAYSFWLLYSVRRVLYFTHAMAITAGAYFTLASRQLLGLPLSYSICIGILLTAALGCAMHIVFYTTLRNRGASLLVQMLASIGIYVVLQNAVSMSCGDELRSIRSHTIQEGFSIMGARLTAIQAVTACVSVASACTLWLILKKTRIGRAVRSVSSNPALADVCGINSDSVMLCAFAGGSAVAGLAGVLFALDMDMRPTMGLNALMMGVVAVIIGGVNSIPGIAMGALLLALAQHFGAWLLGSQWQDAIAFAVLVLFLCVRPQGFCGREVESAAV